MCKKNLIVMVICLFMTCMQSMYALDIPSRNIKEVPFKKKISVSLGAEQHNYDSVLSLSDMSVLSVSVGFSEFENQHWFLKFSKANETPMSKTMFISSQFKTAVFNKLDMTCLGLGFRYQFKDGMPLFLNLEGGLVSFMNKSVDSGFSGIKFDVGVGVNKQLTRHLFVGPFLNFSYLSLAKATLDGDEERLNQSISGMGLNLGLDFKLVF